VAELVEGSIVCLAKILRIFIELSIIEPFRRQFIALFHAVGDARQALYGDVAGIPFKGQDLLERDKAIALEKCPVVRRLVVFLEERRVKALHQQPPVLVALAKVDGSIDRLGAAPAQPLYGFVEQGKGVIAVVHALEEADAAHRIWLRPVALMIDKSGDAPHELAGIIPQDEASRFPLIESLIELRGEDRAHVGLQRANPVGVISVYDVRHAVKQPPPPLVRYFY
jgi:hypothetical protein